MPLSRTSKNVLRIIAATAIINFCIVHFGSQYREHYCAPCMDKTYSLPSSSALVITGRTARDTGIYATTFNGTDISVQFEEKDSTRQVLCINGDSGYYSIALRFNHDNYRGNILDTGYINQLIVATASDCRLAMDTSRYNYAYITDSMYHSSLDQYTYVIQCNFHTAWKGVKGPDIEMQIRDVRLLYGKTTNTL